MTRGAESGFIEPPMSQKRLDAETLDLLAIWFTAVKILHAVGALPHLPPLVALIGTSPVPASQIVRGVRVNAMVVAAVSDASVDACSGQKASSAPTARSYAARKGVT